ncbi:MAG: VanZ family protein [Parcubacteria group bacterium]|nr:VanZ family protein [Parcubacteria group bacterium]
MMKKFLLIFSIITVVAVAVSFGDKVYAQSGDLCGGTGGNGEIVSIGSNTFTLKLNEGGNKGTGNLIVALGRNATIETSNGYATLSDLKIGDRVTLVGDNNRDGTFTADAVVVCNGTETIGTGSTSSPQAGQANPIAVRNENSEAYEKVNGTINTVTILLVGLIWLGIITFLLLKKKKGLVYVLFFSIFYIYLYKVLDYTLIQFQSLLLLQHFVPNLMLNGFSDGTNVNLIPLATLTLEDVKTSFLNILFMMPFGFGLPFITNFRMKRVVVAGLLVSIVIELLQLVTGFMANTTFRVADINDLIFNTVGVAIGYLLFALFVRIYRHISRNWKMRANPILRYIAERPQVDK